MTIGLVTSALRITLEEDEPRYDKYDKQITSQRVRAIYANFLFEDSFGYIHFTHQTARSFILSIKVDGDDQSTQSEFTPERDNRSVA
jgi:hypothetical protein